MIKQTPSSILYVCTPVIDVFICLCLSIKLQYNSSSHIKAIFCCQLLLSPHQKASWVCFTETDGRRSGLIPDLRSENEGLNTERLQVKCVRIGWSEEPLLDSSPPGVKGQSPRDITQTTSATSSVGLLQLANYCFRESQ